ncbi:hypothetical protein B0H67DRAFT_558642 [Lasiosphaeris hirsuta]|uniref:Uncharacterized protein n=1 Tax=Lasiosphaeris hirsuta TaxID=260670 RepID=A0AA39ZRH7_9PEZI|nr:hypothetical protein B0H67DRAFT_558642 [Lasiosphaeris hirsuta]
MDQSHTWDLLPQNTKPTSPPRSPPGTPLHPLTTLRTTHAAPKMAPEQRPPNANLTSLFLQLKREREAEHNTMCTVFEAMTKALDQGLSQTPPGKAYESLALGQTPKIPGWEALPSLTQSSAPLEPTQHQRATERRPRSLTPRHATANDDTSSEGTPSPPPPHAYALGPSTPMSNQKVQAEWETVVAKGYKKRLVLKAPEGYPWNKASAGKVLQGLGTTLGTVPTTVRPTVKGNRWTVTLKKGKKTNKAIEKAAKIVSFDTKPKTPFFRVFNSTIARYLEPKRKISNYMRYFEFH